jgi:hypothetical protein
MPCRNEQTVGSGVGSTSAICAVRRIKRLQTVKECPKNVSVIGAGGSGMAAGAEASIDASLLVF